MDLLLSFLIFCIVNFIKWKILYASNVDNSYTTYAYTTLNSAFVLSNEITRFKITNKFICYAKCTQNAGCLALLVSSLSNSLYCSLYNQTATIGSDTISSNSDFYARKRRMIESTLALFGSYSSSDVPFSFDFCGNNNNNFKLMTFYCTSSQVTGLEMTASNNSVYSYGMIITPQFSIPMDLINGKIKEVTISSGQTMDGIRFKYGTLTNDTTFQFCGSGNAALSYITGTDVCGIYGTFCDYYGWHQLCKIGFMTQSFV